MSLIHVLKHINIRPKNYFYITIYLYNCLYRLTFVKIKSLYILILQDLLKFKNHLLTKRWFYEMTNKCSMYLNIVIF